jgi:beta-mannosidase
MHNEPISITDTQDETLTTMFRTALSTFVWSWNRDIMDSRLKQTVAAEDPTRPAVRASGEYAVPLLRTGTDSHFYMGWYSGAYGPLGTDRAALPQHHPLCHRVWRAELPKR